MTARGCTWCWNMLLVVKCTKNYRNINHLMISAVDLNFPIVFSDCAGDLIAKLLCHNPNDCLPLLNVINHPRVRQTLTGSSHPQVPPKDLETAKHLPHFYLCIFYLSTIIFGTFYGCSIII
ncbi:hypothetical protein OJAV_G00103760 [Oryzias javanicus]|uniref:Uncharacterized protein n=1 Tax=Oryzias javanicus TaxID=123683 RepID=A0A437CY54_ORYJA|nr:hypothetical protein OJAV_G00103760 [Oryzias javanicus]